MKRQDHDDRCNRFLFDLLCEQAGELVFKLASRAATGALDRVLIGDNTPCTKPEGLDYHHHETKRASEAAPSTSTTTTIPSPSCCWTTREYRAHITDGMLWERFQSLDRMLGDMLDVSKCCSPSVKAHDSTEGSTTATEAPSVTRAASTQLPSQGAHPLLKRYKTVDMLLQRSIDCFRAASSWHLHFVAAGRAPTASPNAADESIAGDGSDNGRSPLMVAPVPALVSASSQQKTARQTPERFDSTTGNDEYVSLQKKLAFTWNERARFQVRLVCYTACVVTVQHDSGRQQTNMKLVRTYSV